MVYRTFVPITVRRIAGVGISDIELDKDDIGAAEALLVDIFEYVWALSPQLLGEPS